MFKKTLSLFLLSCSLLLQGAIKESDFRKQHYKPYPKIETLAREMGLSTYNRFENPTGIYFSKGDSITLRAKLPSNAPVALVIHNFEQEGGTSQYPLKDGLNRIVAQNSGLGYISYYTDDPNLLKKSAYIEIKGGKCNGYFDGRRHNEDDWKFLLKNANCNILDIVGEHVQLAYPVNQLRRYCPEQGKKLIRLYDYIVRQQFIQMGFVKYKRVPRNKMFARVIWQGYMHADGIGAAFHNDTMHIVANPDKIVSGDDLGGNMWGIAHELGHVNQTRPGFRWVCTTEVTNNIFAAWIQFLLTEGKHLRLEHEVCNDGDEVTAGGRFNSYLNSALVRHENWLTMKGPDKLSDYQNGGDHFVKLCPLWQLQLYYVAAAKGRSHYNPDFYGDITELIRILQSPKMSNGTHQLNFMRYACDIAKEDLTPFFRAAGMLRPIDKYLDDYTRGQLTITEEECQKLIKYAAKYPRPASPVIHYISGNSIEAFQQQKEVIGTENQGCRLEKNNLIVSHSVWQNVVAFECYDKNKKLRRACIVNTGDPSRATTRILLPQGTAYVCAVSWNGKRTIVYTF